MSESRQFWNQSGSGVQLILLNALVFVAFLLLRSVLHLSNQLNVLDSIVNAVQLPGSLMQLLMQPWSIVTHMFVHLGFWHLLFNMLTLYFATQLFTRYFPERYISAIYLFAGLSGAFVFLVSVNTFPVFSRFAGQIQALGASAAAMGVLMAVCFFRPKDEVLLFGIIRLRLGIIALLFILADIAQIGTGSNEAGHLAHLGGALFGYIWSVNMKQGRNLAQLPRLKFARRNKTPLKAHRNYRVTPMEADEQYNLSKHEKQKKVDEILDKISRSGYDSLNAEEKRILFEISKEQ